MIKSCGENESWSFNSCLHGMIILGVQNFSCPSNCPTQQICQHQLCLFHFHVWLKSSIHKFINSSFPWRKQQISKDKSGQHHKSHIYTKAMLFFQIKIKMKNCDPPFYTFRSNCILTVIPTEYLWLSAEVAMITFKIKTVSGQYYH